MNRMYETVFVLNPGLPDEDADKLVGVMENVAKERGASVKVDRWGKRRLAFEVAHHKEGNYVLFTIDTTDSGVIHELERRMRIEDNVIRYLSVRVDLERRRAVKLSLLRGVPPPWERQPDPPPEPGVPVPEAVEDDREAGRDDDED